MDENFDLIDYYSYLVKTLDQNTMLDDNYCPYVSLSKNNNVWKGHSFLGEYEMKIDLPALKILKNLGLLYYEHIRQDSYEYLRFDIPTAWQIIDEI